MQLRYNYRLYPAPAQRAALARAFGCARVVFNDGLRLREEAHAAGLPYVSDADLSARLTAAKATPGRAWLGEVSAVVLQQALAGLNAACRNFFASLKGARKGPKMGRPMFRSRKDHRQAARFTANARFKVLANGKLRLPKIGDVPVRWSRPLRSEPSSVTVIKDPAGRYFASFVIETEPGILPEAEPVVGLDLGLTSFAPLLDGRKITAPRFLRRAEKKLRRRQRDLSRKQRGSSNRDKARVKVARVKAEWKSMEDHLPHGEQRLSRFAGVGTHPARRLWATLEPLHDVLYFGDGVRPAGIALGLRGFWMTYFAFRAAPLGPVPAPPVIAAFAGFHPDMIAKALPDAWSRTTPAACLEARTAVSTAALREAGVDPRACERAADLLGPVAAAADPTGRPLFAANAALPLPGDAVGRLWQLATTLREHRGDGHIAALVSEGISGLEAHLLQVADGRFPDALIRQVRGWPAEDWATAARALHGRGLLTAGGSPGLTPAGRAVLAAVESRTDERAWTGGLSLLGEQGAEEVLALLRPSVRAVFASGIIPEVNPTGLRPAG